MRAVIQRVDEAVLTVKEEEYSRIAKGLMVLIGIEAEDDRKDAEWCMRKIVNMRIFADDAGKMNDSLKDADGEILLVSQFTLHASTKKGNRPSFIRAASPKHATPLYEYCITLCQNHLGEDKVQTGKFGAHMDIALTNNGPVTIIIDSKQKE